MGYAEDYRLGAAAARNPALLQYILRQQQQQQEDVRAMQMNQILDATIGSNPLFANGLQPSNQQNLPSLPFEQLPINTAPPKQEQTANFGLYNDMIMKAAQQTGLKPEEIYQIIQKESGGNPNAQSPTGPQGLMQLSKAAAQDVGLDPAERFDPEKNIMAGAQYYASLKNEFGPDAHLAYHDGPGAVRKGNISDAGRQYAASFDGVTGATQSTQQPSQHQVRSPEYQGGSKFLPNPMGGGSGLLGQDMDPVRRAYFEHLQQVARSGHPDAAGYVQKGLENMMQAHLTDIQRTATAKDLALTNLQPGTKEYSDAILQNMLKPSTQINMGPGKPPEGYTWNQDGTSLSFVPGGPHDPNTKPLTESQGNAYLFGSRSAEAQKVLNRYDYDPEIDNKKLVAKHVAEQIPGLGDIASPLINSQLNPKEQMLDQARRDFVNALLRRESGAAISASEFSNAYAQYFPAYGDSKEAIAQKRKNRETAVKGIAETAGPRGKEIKVPEFTLGVGDIGPDGKKIARLGTSASGKRVFMYEDGSRGEM